jgi:YD repeat-containing protein
MKKENKMKKVKKITRYRRFVDDNDNLLNEYKSSFQEFDSNNNTIKEVDFTQSGEIETASGFKYDEQNRLVEEIHYFDDEEVGEIIRYKYNEEGKTSEIETTYADGSISLKKVSRSENALTVKAFDEDGELDGEEIVKYNADGKVIEEISIDEDKVVVDRKVYTYNEKNQLASKTNFGPKEEFLQKLVFEYDKNGNVSRETQLNRKDKPVRQVIYTHNNDNKLIEWENLQYIQQMKYDEEGRLIYEETRNRNSDMVESFTEYRFGEDGLLAETRSFVMGEQYQLEPGVYARGKLTFIINRHNYEFFD